MAPAVAAHRRPLKDNPKLLRQKLSELPHAALEQPLEDELIRMDAQNLESARSEVPTETAAA